MAKLVRPYVPLPVQLSVAARQFLAMKPKMDEKEFLRAADTYLGLGRSTQRRLKWLLAFMFPDAPKVDLDHRPPLSHRHYNPRIKDVAARFTPNANDPDYMEWIPRDAHQERTTGRKVGAARTVTTRGSDVGELARARKIAKRHAEFVERRAVGKRKIEPKQTTAKRKIAARKNPWPQGRKIKSKGFRK